MELSLVDIAIQKVIEQGQPSAELRSNVKMACLYRGPNGTKCAVGHLIKDEFYNSDFEGKSVSDCMVTQALEMSNPDKLNQLSSLLKLKIVQSCHDNAATRYLMQSNDQLSFVGLFKQELTKNGFSID